MEQNLLIINNKSDGKNNFLESISVPYDFHAFLGCSAIIILCELNQNEKREPVKMQELYGIELAKKLRRENVTAPIIFTSFLSRKQVYKEKLERGILNTIGHSFIQLPCTPQQLEQEAAKMKPLNELEMYDIVHNYCSLGGIIKMLLHSLSGLQSALNNPSNNPGTIKDKIRTAIVQAHDVFKKSSGTALAEFDLKYKTLTSQNLNEAIRFAENIGTELTELYATDEHSSSKLKAKGNWKLLLLDDEITEDHVLVLKLRERNVQVMCASTAKDAKIILEKDPLFSLVVSDYRLEVEVEGVKIHQPTQGYQFLKEISDERPGYLRLAALSSLPRKFLMESFRHYGIRVEIFSKKDYWENDATINLLSDELTELGNENSEAIVRTPRITSKTWIYFEPLYKWHRNSTEYRSNESDINKRAKEYCEGIVQNKYPFQLEGYTALNFDAKKAQPKKKATNKLSVTENGEEEIEVNRNYYTIFLHKSICRRVALWFTQYNKAWQLKDVLRIIHGNSYVPPLNTKEADDEINVAKIQINNNLALSLKEYPWNMTVEEKYWLIIDMGIDNIDNIEEKENFILTTISESLKLWLDDVEINEDISDKREFQSFFLDNAERYGANFKILRSFLHQLYLFLVGKDDLIQALQMQIITWQEKMSNFHGTENISRFTSYLEELRRRLMFTKSFKKDAKVKIGTYDEFYSNIITSAIKDVPSKEQDDFPGIAMIFYNSVDQNNANLNSKSAWIQALLEFHATEMKKWYGDDFGFDEIKAYRKKRASNIEEE